MLKALQEKFAGLMTQAEAIRLKYDGKSGDMTAAEMTEWTNLVGEAETVKGQIETAHKQAQLQSFASASANALPTGVAPVRDDKGAEQDAALTPAQAGQKAFVKFLRGGAKGLSSQDLSAIALATSTKAYQADNPASGGFLVTPQQFVQDLIILMKDNVFIRGLATNYTVDRAESLGIPALDQDPADPDWTTELATGNEDNNMVFGKRELKPNPLAKRVKLSNKLLRQAAMDPESIVRDRLAYKFGIAEEKAFLVGDGANKPLGVFTPSAQGISVARDVQTSTVNALKADDLIATLYSLKGQYQARSTWVLNRSVMLAIRLLKDSNNNYLWSTGIGPGQAYAGQPETLLSRPYCMSEYAPAAIATGSYAAIIGDFSRYVIATALDMQLQVLDQLYAENNQTGYIARMEVDGMPVLEEAFARCLIK